MNKGGLFFYYYTVSSTVCCHWGENWMDAAVLEVFDLFLIDFVDFLVVIPETI